MKLSILAPVALVMLLIGCGQDEPDKPKAESKSFGAGVGENYRSMLDSAQQSVDQMNQQMLRGEQEVRERRE